MPHPAIRGKEGSGDRAYSELLWRQDLVELNQIQDLNLLLGNALLAACAMQSASHCLWLPVIFLQLLHSDRTIHGHQTLFLLRLKGVASETKTVSEVETLKNFPEGAYPPTPLI